jgi:hypothetical protein
VAMAIGGPGERRGPQFLAAGTNLMGRHEDGVDMSEPCEGGPSLKDVLCR